MTDLQIIPAGRGAALRLAAGEAVEVVNTHGTQVVDTWAFCAEDLGHYMSMPHTRVETGRLCPRPGQAFFSNRRLEILRLEEDTCPGVHDTIMAACDPERYRRLGAVGPHRSCSENLREALGDLGLASDTTPQPLNLFMNIPIHPDGTLEQGLPLTRPGDRVVLRALRDVVVAFSACPQDMTPINGADGAVKDAHFRKLPPG